MDKQQQCELCHKPITNEDIYLNMIQRNASLTGFIHKFCRQEQERQARR